MVVSTRTPRYEPRVAHDVTEDNAYFYDDDGSTVPLVPTDELAVQWDAADGADVPEDVLAELRRQARDLRGGVSMLPSSAMPKDVAETLDEAGALQPVYRYGDDALVVVLPEVRVEVDDEQQVRQLHDYLASADVQSEVVRDEGDQVVLRPSSNRGADALQLANRIEESVKPAMSQARLLRVVRRP
jgi:hypothetical protein